MSEHTPLRVNSKASAAALILSFALLTTSAAGQSHDADRVQRLGMLGGSRIDNVSGTSLSLGGLTHVGPFAVTGLAEGFFYQGRPDPRFQEIPVRIVDPAAPLVQTQDVACADLDTGEVFSYGECVASKASVNAMLDIGVRGSIGSKQLIVGLGYRAGAQSEPYALLALSGAPSHDQAGWIARLAIGRRAMGLQVGFAGIG